MKRSLPPLRLPRSPLVYVVAQVRFSAVVSVEKFVPEIQEKLRHKGFPRFLRSQLPELNFVLPNPTPKVSFTERFEFQNKEADLGIVLTSNFFAVHTNNYKNYEEFEKNISSAIDAIDGSLNLSIVERMGLRYVDLVRPKQDEKWDTYLQPGLLGVDPEKIGIVRDWIRRLEFQGDTELGKLVIRCAQTDQALPPDLQPPSLKYSLTLEPGEIAACLDFDHFSERSADFDPQTVLTMIGDLHDHLDRAFRNSVTTTALKNWGSEEA